MTTSPGLKRDDMPPAFSPDLQGNPAGNTTQMDKPTENSSATSQTSTTSPNSASASSQKESGALGNSSSAPESGAAPDGGAASTSGTATTEADPYALTQEERDAITKPREEQANKFREWLDNYNQETPEARKKRERQEHSRRIIAAVGDGISALSNLYFTSQYAPNAQLHSMSDAVSKRIEQLRAERERNADKYLNYSLRMGDINIAKEKELREAAAQKRAQGLALDRAKREAEEHGWLAALQPDKQREQKNKADAAGYKAQTYKAKADVAPELAAEELESQKAQTEQRKAGAAASRASATASHARAKSYNKTVHHYRGKAYESEKDYTKDVIGDAKAYNERHGSWVPKYVTNEDGKQIQVGTEWKYEAGFHPIVIEDKTYNGDRKPRTPEEIAKETERRLDEEAKATGKGKGYGNSTEKGKGYGN